MQKAGGPVPARPVRWLRPWTIGICLKAKISHEIRLELVAFSPALR